MKSPDWDLVLESLRQSKRRVEDSDAHPSYEFKQERVGEVEQTIAAIRVLRDQHKETA